MRAAGRAWAWGAAGVFASALAAPVWAGPSLSCTATRAGRRVLVDAAVGALVDADLERLIQLGLRGELRVEASLRRRRRFWFDEKVTTVSATHALVWSKRARTLELDGEAVPSDRPLSLALLSLGPLAEGAVGVGTYVVDLSVSLEVVTADSLRETVGFLMGRGRAPDEDRKGLPRVVLEAIASDLERDARATCAVRAP